MIKRICSPNRLSLLCKTITLSFAITSTIVVADCPPPIMYNSGSGSGLNFCLDPYLGVNGAMRYMNWPNNFGGNTFKKHYPEGDIYLGTNFNDYFGIQLGYKVTATRFKTTSLSGEIDLGIPTAVAPQRDLTQAQFKGWHGELVGYLPMWNPSNCVYLYGTIGFTRFDLYQRNKVLEVGSDGGTPLLVGVGVRTFKETKTILSLSLGSQIVLDDMFSFRIFAGWDNTSRFKHLVPRETNSSAVLELKNSYSFGLGLIMYFF